MVALHKILHTATFLNNSFQNIIFLSLLNFSNKSKQLLVTLQQMRYHLKLTMSGIQKCRKLYILQLNAYVAVVGQACSGDVTDTEGQMN